MRGIKKLSYILILCTCVLLFGCSTSKNTKATRFYHSTTTRFNVYFNGKNSYDDGLKQLNQQHKDDFSQVLPLYAVSNHDEAKAIESQMNITIEKCRKAIKNHSIKKKPKKEKSKMKDAEYRKYIAQEEFNPMINRAWMLLAKAEFHKGDFMGAVGTTTYIQKHFATEDNVVAEATIWKARAYAELGWDYEAESTIEKIKVKTLHYSLVPLYNGAMADILLKQKKYDDAIPYLVKAVERETDKYQRVRNNFVLGQLYAMAGERAKAVECFNYAASKAQSYEMQFNATLGALKTEPKARTAIRGLEKMAKSANNKDYLDQIYLAQAQQYLQLGKTDKAIEFMKLAIAKSTRNGIEKAVAAITLADLYYQQKKYIEAEPYYRMAEELMQATADNYNIVRTRKEMLGELVGFYDVKHRQDSLLVIAELSEEEQMKIINQLIEERRKADEAKAKAAADSAALAIANANAAMQQGPTMQQSRGNGSWYFYNPQLVSSGEAEFKRKWGNRQLADNWRVSASSHGSSGGDNSKDGSDKQGGSDSNNVPDSLANDPYNPAYYLVDIPKTDEDKANALGQVATSLLGMGSVYETKIKDDSMAVVTYGEFRRRFANHDRLLDVYYSQYCIYGRLDSTAAQEAVRQKIIAEYPQSKYAQMLSQPDYIERTTKMYNMQDSIYIVTYNAYMRGHYDTVSMNFALMNRDFPSSRLMPKFTLLNALSLGRQGKQAECRVALQAMVDTYSTDEVADMGRGLLALTNQGQSVSTDGAPGDGLNATISTASTASFTTSTVNTDTVTFSADLRVPYNVLLILEPQESYTINQLLYDVAAFNFTRFMVKDFELNVQRVDGRDAIVVSGLAHYDDAKWYRSQLESEPKLHHFIHSTVCTCVLISTENLAKIGVPFTIDDYLKFQNPQQ